MNYKQAKDFTLELINQRSIAGTEIASSYNNQADYLQRIPGLLNAAAITAATRVPIRAVVPVEGLERGRMGQWITYRLPPDCLRVSCLIRCDGPRLQRYHRFRIVGSDLLAVYEGLDGQMHLEYWRRPALLEDEPGEEDELDGTPEVQTALPYYAAAMLVMGDDAFAYATLLDQFESRLTRAGVGPQAEWESVEDAYSAQEWGHDA